MSVSSNRLDDWVQHIAFVGDRRVTPFGPADGLWYGVLSIAGDATGGGVNLIGSLSPDRKEDWVYVVQGLSVVTNDDTVGDEIAIQVATGPLTPTESIITNAVFGLAGSMSRSTVNDLSTFPNSETPPWQGLLCFGDKRIAGNYVWLTILMGTNTNLRIYTGSMWGWLFEYKSFFRNLPPGGTPGITRVRGIFG